jgi:predicted nucleic acid-binding protein
MEDNADLQVLFKGYFRANADAVEAIWRDGKIIPDANVLLNLYRYSDEARDALLNLLENHRSRVWLPHQAAQEYFQNRPAVINEQSKNYDLTLNDISDLYNSFNQKNRHPFLPSGLLAEVEELFQKLNTHLENTKESHLKRLNDDGVFQGSCRLSC